jgi:hypothetical protein
VTKANKYTSHHCFVARRCNSQTNPVARYFNNCQNDVAIDDNLLAYLPAEDQHDAPSWCCRPVGGAGVNG